jgi:hypothetical protein
MFLVGLVLSGVLLAQNVVTNPTGNQAIVQPAGTTLSTNSLSSIAYVTPSDNWSQSPSGSLSAGSGQVISLNPCPRGLWANAFSVTYAYVYISTVGTAEAAPITATTCPQIGGGSGTITVTTAYSHGAGYTVGTASQGVQEAINAASFVPNYTTSTQLGAVVIPPGQYTWQARVTVATPYTTLDFSGSFVTCIMADTCLYLGNATNSSLTWNVVVNNFTGQPGCSNCNYPMIEDSAEHSKLIHVQAANPSPVGGITSGYSFGSLIQVDNDQAAVIDGLDSYNARWYHCDTTFCSAAVKGIGGSGVSGILWIKNSFLDLGCGANGVDNQNANTMRISDSVVEDYPQFGVRSTDIYSNDPNVELDNVYFEVAGCLGTNPLKIGTAGLIVENGFASIKNTLGPLGGAPVYANTGATQYNYYIVVHSSSGAVSAPFFAGIALTNGSGTFPVVWPEIGTTGTITYDVIRTSGTANSPAPYTAVCGGGSTTTCGSVATGLTTAGACSIVGTAHICSFTDNAALNTSNYTVVSPPTYWPAFGDGSGAGVFWPGSVIFTPAADSGGSPPLTGVYFDRLGDNVAPNGTNPATQLVSSFGNMLPNFFAFQCANTFGGAWVSCLESEAGSVNAGATLLQSGQYSVPDTAGLKGRLIFEQGLEGNINGTHRITLVDSNPPKTLATPSMRPTFDANDTYIGLDNTAATSSSNAQLAFGAPVSISNYIGNAGDGTHWKEQLTSSSKSFNVPISLYNGLTTAGAGLAPILGTPFNSGSLTANEPAQTIYTTAPSGAGSAGNYRICITLWPTATGTATAIQGGAIAPSGSGTVTLPVGPALSTATLTHGGGACAALHVAASSAIQCTTTGYSGTGTYKMSCTVEQLQ